jgi:hypothetical protein
VALRGAAQVSSDDGAMRYFATRSQFESLSVRLMGKGKGSAWPPKGSVTMHTAIQPASQSVLMWLQSSKPTPSPKVIASQVEAVAGEDCQ